MNILENNNQSGGDKRTLLAIVLSVIVIVAGLILGPIISPETSVPVPNETQATQSQGRIDTKLETATSKDAIQGKQEKKTDKINSKMTLIVNDSPGTTTERTYTINTDLLEAVFTNRGGNLVSLKLKKHKDKDGAVNLVVKKEDGAGGFIMSFGDSNAQPISDIMNTTLLNDSTIVFSSTYATNTPENATPAQITLRKIYKFKNGEYMFGLTIELKSSINEALPLDTAGFAYTLGIGPQIGPKLTAKPGGNNDYRKFIQYVGGKKKEERPKAGTPLLVKDQPNWVAISGKYFSFIAIPQYGSFQTQFSMDTDPLLFEKDSLILSRPSIKTSSQTDDYYFYFGPKTIGDLSKYNYADQNGFARSGLNLEQAADTSGILTWLENGIKFFLMIFYKLIPNYGIAIILVTILVKAVLFPLTRNGSIASSRMQELQPKMKELQEKFKGNPQKLNQEMAEFYKREGYNPLSGCLPLLIQFPIFIAMYNLFNNHFDLRGALFIPGWIPDLSIPESVISFPEINILIFNVSALRLLPIIYLISQLLYGKYNQMTTAGQSGMQMKMMMYGMPIMFFFILYNTPSGLLVYWIISNVLSIGQQIVINDVLKKRKHALSLSTAVQPKIVNKKQTIKGKRK